MTKIVYNADFGGFSLSYAAMQMYVKLLEKTWGKDLWNLPGIEFEYLDSYFEQISENPIERGE